MDNLVLPKVIFAVVTLCHSLGWNNFLRWQWWYTFVYKYGCFWNNPT